MATLAHSARCTAACQAVREPGTRVPCCSAVGSSAASAAPQHQPVPPNADLQLRAARRPDTRAAYRGWYISWYVFHVHSHMTPQQVTDGLGDKVVHGLAAIVRGAADDLADYRRSKPGIVADHTNRGLANWIHDRLRARALREFDQLGHVSFRDQEPHFDIYVRGTMEDYTVFRLRLKRHSPTGRISNYSTQGALEFISQPQEYLPEPSMATVHLSAGYEWDDEAREMGAPVLSLRDGSFTEVSWLLDLPVPPAGGSHGDGLGPVAPITPTDDGPTLPAIDVKGAAEEQRDAGGARG